MKLPRLHNPNQIGMLLDKAERGSAVNSAAPTAAESWDAAYEDALGTALRDSFADVLAAPVPIRFIELLDRLAKESE